MKLTIGQKRGDALYREPGLVSERIANVGDGGVRGMKSRLYGGR